MKILYKLQNYAACVKQRRLRAINDARKFILAVKLTAFKLPEKDEPSISLHALLLFSDPGLHKSSFLWQRNLERV